MVSSDEYAQNKQAFIDDVTERGAQLGEALRAVTSPIARDVLQTAADATNELLSYLTSPVIDQAIESFHASTTERAKAATDMNTYLAEAGLEYSARTKWQFHDDNWCVDAQVTYHEGTDVHSISAHYDRPHWLGMGRLLIEPDGLVGR